MEEPNLRIVETKDYIFHIKERRGMIPLGAYALHNSDKYRGEFPDHNHLVLCTKNNQLSIEEHWREVVSHLPKVGANLIKEIPLLNIYNY